MTLNKDSWFVKYWLWWGCFSDTTYNVKYNPDDWRYEGSDICSIGRTALIWAPIKSIIALGAIAMPIALLYMLGWAIIFETFKTFITVAILFAVIAVVVGLVWGIPRTFNAVVNSTPAQFLGEWIEAKNGKFCKKVNVA